MFTGIVKTIGHVAGCDHSGSGARLRIEASAFAGRLSPGDSVSINGVCHTVEKASDNTFDVTSVRETLERTTMGILNDGDPVNLELAATLETTMGGHIVQGHVDGRGVVQSMEETNDGGCLITLELPESFEGLVVEKGSVAVDGVSLTVAGVKNGAVTIAIVPYTLEHTIVSEYEVGREVNVEADILGKYVSSDMSRIQPRDQRSGDIR